jgi:hypothetical protein
MLVTSSIRILGLLLLWLPNWVLAELPSEQLDRAVTEQRYEDALSLLEKASGTESEKLAWLRRQSDAGHVPLQYELSRRLLHANLAESLKWYARGRLARTLDVAECRTASASFPTRIILDRITEEVVRQGQADPQLFDAAVQDAIVWDEHRTNIPLSKWICGDSNPSSPEGNVLPLEERKRKRDEARLVMVSKARLESAIQAARERGRKNSYAIVDFNFPSGEDTPDGNVYWLDNNQIVFVGYDVSRLIADGDSRHSTPNGVYIADAKSKKVSTLFEANYIGGLCVFRGFVSFFARSQATQGQ